MRECYHCGDEATERIIYAPSVHAFDQHLRACWVCERHVEAELEELRYLGGDPRVG